LVSREEKENAEKLVKRERMVSKDQLVIQVTKAKLVNLGKKTSFKQDQTEPFLFYNAEIFKLSYFLTHDLYDRFRNPGPPGITGQKGESGPKGPQGKTNVPINTTTNLEIYLESLISNNCCFFKFNSFFVIFSQVN
jgi:hypothetical protein